MHSDNLRAIRQLYEYEEQLRQSLVAKASKDSLDEIRYQAGVIAGVQAAIRLLTEENKDGQ